MKLDTGAFCRNYIQVIKRDGSVQSVGAGLLCRNDEKNGLHQNVKKLKN